MDTFTFEQWVLFLAIRFRDTYRGVAARAYPQLQEQLPLARAGKLTVVQVNSGEAVHFLYTPTPQQEATACRAMTVMPPEGLSLQDWALLHEEGYKRFVERSVGAAPVGHVVLFPARGDDHATMVLEAERIVREHAEALL